MAVLQQNHSFTAKLEWTGAAQGPTKDIRTYSREFEIAMAGKQGISGSAAPGFLGDATRMNPEEMFLAALSGCQMLTYLALAAQANVEVISYTDECEAMLSMLDGHSKITKVILRPRIEILSGEPQTASEL